MIATRIRTTLLLEADTLKVLDRIARRLGVSRSQALSRAILAADKVAEVPALAALDALQGQVGLSADAAVNRSVTLRIERGASAERRERRAQR